MLTGILLLVAGVLLLPSSPKTDVGAVPPSSARVGSPSAAAKGSPAASPQPDGRPFAPLAVQVLRAGISAGVVPVSVGRDGMLGIPEDVRQVGWWQAGAAAGSAAGTVVLVGHVDSAKQGAGAFSSLRQLDPGDRVVLSGAGGARTVYVVSARRQYPKSALPRAEVFGQGSLPRLVLLTCGGPFNSATRHYEDNVVVYATPLSRGS
ncbi:MAG: class F sortase [Mycobacteriales bacterium]